MKQKLAAFVNNRSLQTRMMVLCLSIAAISTALMAFFSYSRASELVQAQAYQRAEDSVGQSASYVDQRLRNVLGQVYSLVTGATEAFRDVAYDDGGLTDNARVAAVSRLQSVFAGLRVRDSLISNAYLYTPYRDYYELIFQPKGNIEASRLFGEVQQNRLENRWLSPRLDEIFTGEQRVIPLVVPINYSSGQNNQVVSGGAQQGIEFGKNFLVVNLNERTFTEYLRGLKLGSQSLVYIAAPDGTVNTSPGALYQNLLQESGFQARLRDATNSQGFFEYDHAGQTLFVNYASVDTSGWKIVSLQPKAELLAGLGDIQRFTGLVGFICLALSLGLSSWLAATITRPIAVLKRLMRRVEERDFSVRFPSRYRDEIGQLGQAFNSMTEEIDGLIRKVEQEQHAKRLAELEALQAQINPHFLYNTLDSIYWKALMKENDAVAEMAVSLSNLFRLGLNGGREMTTLAKELEHVRNYLEIQKLCYGDTFSYTIESDPALNGMSVVKLILQPLVENSLTHGFELMQAQGRGPGQLTVEARQDPASGRVWLRVSDNGRGFEVARLQASLNHNDNPASADGHGYALRNVHARLRLHYGAGYELKLLSQPYEDTSIEIWLPAPIVSEPETEGEFLAVSENNLPVEQDYRINIVN